jgi:transposase
MHRRVATRFEKTARNYRAVMTLAAIILWLHRPWAYAYVRDVFEG